MIERMPTIGSVALGVRLQTSVLLTGEQPDYAQLRSVLHHVLQAIPAFRMTQRDSLQPNNFEMAAHAPGAETTACEGGWPMG